MRTDPLISALYFARTRWWLNFHSRTELLAWQTRSIEHFMRTTLLKAPYYQGIKARTLHELPLMDKGSMMAGFNERNTRGVALNDALAVGLQAEQSRNFSPRLGDLTVGLSSGTSGNRGVFLVSDAERLRWAGVLLGRALPSVLLRHILSPWKKPLRIAFFLRANSNLYTTLNSRRIDFAFYDLLEGAHAALASLNRHPPDVLVGPPALLRALSDCVRSHALSIHPQHIISVADVLEPQDRTLIEAAFHLPVHQLYQATEGFLGYTCEQGTLHLNEAHMHIEPEWLDAEQTRFHPIVTDFSRETQLIVRYRLNDVLRVAAQPCACGRAERAIEAIEGRSDDVVWLPAQGTNQLTALYPDTIRRQFLLSVPAPIEYSMRQEGMHWIIGLQPHPDTALHIQALQMAFAQLCATQGLQEPTLAFTRWQAPAPGAKRRRIVCIHTPE